VEGAGREARMLETSWPKSRDPRISATQRPARALRAARGWARGLSRPGESPSDPRPPGHSSRCDGRLVCDGVEGSSRFDPADFFRESLPYTESTHRTRLAARVGFFRADFLHDRHAGRVSQVMTLATVILFAETGAKLNLAHPMLPPRGTPPPMPQAFFAHRVGGPFARPHLCATSRRRGRNSRSGKVFRPKVRRNSLPPNRGGVRRPQLANSGRADRLLTLAQVSRSVSIVDWVRVPAWTTPYARNPPPRNTNPGTFDLKSGCDVFWHARPHVI